MNTIALKLLPTRTYKNFGQHAEQVVRFTLTNEICKADNKKFDEATDVLDMQIKTAKATICKGSTKEEIIAHIENEKAKKFGYVKKDLTCMYVMNKKEYAEFIFNFSYTTTESAKNGGKVKTRLYDESKKMIEWLENH